LIGRFLQKGEGGGETKINGNHSDERKEEGQLEK